MKKQKSLQFQVDESLTTDEQTVETPIEAEPMEFVCVNPAPMVWEHELEDLEETSEMKSENEKNASNLGDS